MAVRTRLKPGVRRLPGPHSVSQQPLETPLPRPVPPWKCPPRLRADSHWQLPSLVGSRLALLCRVWRRCIRLPRSPRARRLPRSVRPCPGRALRSGCDGPFPESQEPRLDLPGRGSSGAPMGSPGILPRQVAARSAPCQEGRDRARRGCGLARRKPRSYCTRPLNVAKRSVPCPVKLGFRTCSHAPPPPRSEFREESRPAAGDCLARPPPHDFRAWTAGVSGEPYSKDC